MDDVLGARHASTLNGALLPPGRASAVAVVLAEPAASCPAWQAAAWLLCELVSRGTGHASRLHVVTGDTQAVLSLPGVAVGAALGPALVARSAAIGGVPAAVADVRPAAAVTVRVGPGDLVPELEVFADNWGGGVRSPGQGLHLGLDHPNLLIGALVGACHAAAALFRQARLVEPGPAGVWHDTWALRLSNLTDAAPSAGPAHAPLDLNGLKLAGMGAVGNAFAFAALTHPAAAGTLHAADYDDVDLTNLNRCLLFLRDDLEQLKADVANAAAQGLGSADAALHVAPERAEKAFADAPVSTLISAVDTNRARAAINRLVPRVTLAGSTWQLRAQTSMFGEPGPCLRCFNAPEPTEADRAIKSRVRAASPDELAVMAAQTSTTAELLLSWAAAAGCGELDAALLPTLRADDPPTFSVGFVSVLSGVLLAATAIRVQHRVDVTPTTARAQLYRPAAGLQGPQPAQPDPDCPACGDGGALPAAWRHVWSDQ
jgi:molybdopterin/thiamine biosynthesis adenylyltransferase